MQNDNNKWVVRRGTIGKERTGKGEKRRKVPLGLEKSRPFAAKFKTPTTQIMEI